MSKRSKRLALLVALSAGTLFQGISTGCGQTLAQFALQAFDACAVLNCADSAFFDFCDPVILFTDCP